MICIHCEIEFDPKHWRHKKGLLAECGDCSGRDVRKSIGVLIVDGKTDYHFSILHSPTAAQAFLVAKAGKCGPTHCHSSLGLNSNGSSTPKDKIDGVQESLEKESKKERKRDRYRG